MGRREERELQYKPKVWWRTIEIGGMTFDTYDPDKDPSGLIGIYLANLPYRELGSRIFTEEGLTSLIYEANKQQEEKKKQPQDKE